MNARTLFALTLSTLVLAHSARAVTPPAAAPAPVQDVSKMDPAALEALSQGAIPAGTTLLVPAGYKLPIAMRVSGDTLFTPDKGASVGLEARRDIYLKFDGNTVLISLDGNQYFPPTDLFSGQISFGLSGEDGGHAVKGSFEFELRTKPTDQ